MGDGSNRHYSMVMRPRQHSVWGTYFENRGLSRSLSYSALCTMTFQKSLNGVVVTNRKHASGLTYQLGLRWDTTARSMRTAYNFIRPPHRMGRKFVACSSRRHVIQLDRGRCGVLV